MTDEDKDESQRGSEGEREAGLQRYRFDHANDSSVVIDTVAPGQKQKAVRSAALGTTLAHQSLALLGF